MFKKWICQNRNWVFQNFPFLENDFDALTDYELFCKMVEYAKSLAISNEKFVNDLKANLDTMYNEGKFDSLIEEIVNLQTTFTFDSVADMKSATNLINGSFTRTSGFYSYNDGGSSYYKIRNLEEIDTIDEITLISLYDENLVAELLPNNIMNVKEFGAKGDGINDDSLSIQKALDFCKNIIIKNGIYLIDSVENYLTPSDNSTIKIINATLKAITNSSDNYSIIRLYQVENVIIDGGIIEGDRLTHLDLTGEWGHCITIRECENITLKNITLKNAWGDGLYVVDSKNINTYNLVADNNRRNGFSIISCDGFSSNNDYIQNTNGTFPQSGVDIEPNESSEVLKNIVFNNLKTYNNSGAGVEIHLGQQTSESDSINIILNNCYDEESTNGLTIYKNQYTSGNITINDSYLLNNKSNGINLRQCYNSDLKIKINNPTIINCNTSNNSSPKYGCGISLYIDDNDTDLPLGNVIIKEPYITNYRNDQRYIYIFGSVNNFVENINVLNPLNNDNNKNLTLQNINNLIFTDIYNNFVNDSDNTLELAGYNTYSIIKNTLYTTTRTNTIANSFPIGREMTFINTNLSGYAININLPTDTYLRGFSVNANPTINIPSAGNSVTIKRISNSDFIVLNYVGNITAN